MKKGKPNFTLRGIKYYKKLSDNEKLRVLKS